ncbi:MAG: hypothetical protein WCF36_18895 [Candidatus Nanopelagicales bacterium]
MLRRQRGVLADWQAREVGLSRDSLLRASRTSWTQLSPHVFAADETDPDSARLRMAAVLECGPGALLAGRSALLESGWRAAGHSEDCVDVIVPRGRRLRSRGAPLWLRRHHPEDEVRGAGSPARTSTNRAAIDAAAWARSPREALFLLTSAAQQRLTTPGAMRQVLEDRARVRNAPVIRQVLAEIEFGVTSVSEATFMRECRRRGLPQPRMQTSRRDAQGRRRFTDAEFTLPDGRTLIVEVDGIGHLAIDTWHADITRQNGLTISTGALILRVTNWELEHDPDPFFAVMCPLFDPA